MRDYFSIQYTSFTENKINSIDDISSYLKKFSFSGPNVLSSEESLYSFEPVGNKYIIFGLCEDNFISNIKDENILNILNEKFNIQDKLLSYYKDMVFHAFIYKDEVYVFCLVYLDSNFVPGLYETFNVASLMGLSFVKVIQEKILAREIYEEKNLIFTQRHGVDFNNKIFLKQ